MDKEQAIRQKQIMRRKRKMQKRKRVFILTCFIVCSFAVLALVFKAPFFDIKGITVTGNKMLKKEKIIAASKIAVDENIFSMSMSGAEEKIMQMPYVKNAEVKRVFPDKISVKIEECVPRAYIKHGKKYVVIDSEGKILELVKDTKKHKIMTINGLSLKNTEPGKNILDNADSRIECCVDTLKILEKVKFIDKIISLDFTHLTAIKMNYEDRVFVNLGSYENYDDFEYKVKECKHIISEELSVYEKIELDFSMDNAVSRPYEDPEERKKRLEEERKQREEAEKLAEGDIEDEEEEETSTEAEE